MDARRRSWLQRHERRAPRKNVIDLPDATTLGHEIAEPRDARRRIDLEVAAREFELDGLERLGVHGVVRLPARARHETIFGSCRGRKQLREGRLRLPT